MIFHSMNMSKKCTLNKKLYFNEILLKEACLDQTLLLHIRFLIMSGLYVIRYKIT